MTFAVPGWWAFVLLALAAFRLFRLIAEDSLLDRPRDALTGRLGEKAELFVVCPWCLGFWITAGWWLAWLVWPHWALVAATPLALSATVGLAASRLDTG